MSEECIHGFEDGMCSVCISPPQESKHESGSRRVEHTFTTTQIAALLTSIKESQQQRAIMSMIRNKLHGVQCSSNEVPAEIAPRTRFLSS